VGMRQAAAVPWRGLSKRVCVCVCVCVRARLSVQVCARSRKRARVCHCAQPPLPLARRELVESLREGLAKLRASGAAGEDGEGAAGSNAPSIVTGACAHARVRALFAVRRCF
jgi:hypothetical protein